MVQLLLHLAPQRLLLCHPHSQTLTSHLLHYHPHLLPHQLSLLYSPSLPRNSLLPSNMHLSAQPTASPTARRNDTTRPVLNAPPRGGFQTRRYLATLAGSNTDGSDASFITIAESDEDDTDLLHNDVVVNSLPRGKILNIDGSSKGGGPPHPTMKKMGPLNFFF
ncbi:hypothetical protein P5673_015401 [Acropora cervicornis]|uniref:Uncharacterized protein n=1 Tax=Acropora cervicornis TaxID=6130 RepID=A0AAD9QIJ6_ACRCE|nr:hypothetical protein P5673_015401 [Acropora cervicornis]